jgi:hypothetical protein
MSKSKRLALGLASFALVECAPLSESIVGSKKGRQKASLNCRGRT